MSEQTPSLEEQEDVLDRLTWTDDDIVMQVSKEGKPIYLVGRDCYLYTLDEKKSNKRLNDDLMSAAKLTALMNQVTIYEGQSDNLTVVHGTVLRPFLSSDGVMMRLAGR